MPAKLPQSVRDNLQKCRLAAISAVEVYNKPGSHFRSAQYLVLMVMAWTALFHAIFFRRGRNPWYRKKGIKAVRYQKIDGEPKHWDLAECLKQYFESNNPPERQNLEFLIALRNKIEHRHLPELDIALYGECQAALLNLEEFLSSEFGARYALQEQLAVSLQFSRTIPSEKKSAARTLAQGNAKSVADFIERFRGNLPSTTLNSMRYSFSVYLVPRVSNREKAADAAVQFVKVDEASEDELERLERLNVLIREKHIPIANLEMYKPSRVIEALEERLPFCVTMNAHTDAWKHYEIRPATGAENPEKTRPEYCIYDAPHGDYLYTRAWIDKLAQDFSDPVRYEEITGREPRPK